MRKISFLFITLSLIVTSFVFAQHFWRGETMALKKVEKMWGTEPFVAAKFKTGSPNERSKMAASLIKDKRYIGKSPIDVRNELGSADGYYFSDVYPAYIIAEKIGDAEKPET